MRLVLVSGDFGYQDDLAAFRTSALMHQASAVSFDSPGSVAKAIELGRLIRSLGLNTIQVRGLDCVSACAFAFLGEVRRAAEPGVAAFFMRERAANSCYQSAHCCRARQRLGRRPGHRRQRRPGGGSMKKASDNPMQSAHASPRCSATSKRSGLPCRAPAVRGRHVCRMHGALGGAPKGVAHGRYVHGQFTCQAVEQRQALELLIRMARQSAAEL